MLVARRRLWETTPRVYLEPELGGRLSCPRLSRTWLAGRALGARWRAGEAEKREAQAELVEWASWP